jgi:hypothetical protein
MHLLKVEQTFLFLLKHILVECPKTGFYRFCLNFTVRIIDNLIAAESVKSVEFPSVTICSSGNSEVVTNAKLLTQFKDFLTKVLNVTSDMSPLDLAVELNLVKYKKNNLS